MEVGDEWWSKVDEEEEEEVTKGKRAAEVVVAGEGKEGWSHKERRKYFVYS